jgi:hypothetical protein
MRMGFLLGWPAKVNHGRGSSKAGGFDGRVSAVEGGLMQLVKVVPALLAAAWLAGCATTIPATDDTPPRLELTIRGPAIGTQTMSNPPRAQWTAAGGAQLFDLVPGGSYNFRFVVSDSGGVARAHLRMPAGFTVSNLGPAGVTNDADALQRRLTLRGTRDDPRTGLVIGGVFQVPTAGNLSFDFQGEGDDFGGVAARTNQTFLTVTAAYGLATP